MKRHNIIQRTISRIVDNIDYSTVLLNGSTLSYKNRSLFLQCMRSYAYVICDIMGDYSTDDNSIRRAIRSSLTFFSDNDIVSVLSFFDGIDCFLKELVMPITKRALNTRLAAMAREHGIIGWKRGLTPVKQLIEKFILDLDPANAHMRDVRTYLLYPKKLSFSDIGVEDKMLEQYFDIEQHLGSFVYDNAMLDELAEIIYDWFKDFRYTSIGNHGSGTVAEGKLSIYEKYMMLTSDNVLDRVTNNVETLYSTPMLSNKGTVERCSRLTFVPKSATKLRSISMEPVTLQFYQQGLMKALYRYIRKSKLAKHIVLHDQTQNQIYAHIGSLAGSYCTIDLSSASDCVSTVLVRRLFHKVPHLYKYLISFRSTHTLVKGEKIKLNKFAPMGSSNCFPVECLVFAAITKYTIAHYNGIEKELDPSFFSIYGDDIIAPNYVFNELQKNLALCGFFVNKSKSYGDDSFFRESCGKEYYRGIDVTPLYYRVPVFRYNKLTPETYSSIIAYCNNTGKYGYSSARLYGVRVLLNSNCVPAFTTDIEDSSKIFSATATNYHIVNNCKLCEDYQGDYGYYTIVTTVAIEPVIPHSLAFHNRHHRLYNQIGLYEWLRNTRNRVTPPDEDVGVSTLYSTATTFGRSVVSLM